MTGLLNVDCLRMMINMEGCRTYQTPYPKISVNNSTNKQISNRANDINSVVSFKTA